jgi:hypothetical protein
MIDHPQKRASAVKSLHAGACAIREARECFAKGSESRIANREMPAISKSENSLKSHSFFKSIANPAILNCERGRENE